MFSYDPWINNRTTLIYEQRFSIHGRVLEKRSFAFGWVQNQRITAHSMCVQYTEWDVWWQKAKTGCSQDHQGTNGQTLDSFTLEWGEFVCDVICESFNMMVDDEDPLSCEMLEVYAKDNYLADPAGPWNYLAICTAPKGIVAVLTLALMMTLLGFLMCFCCSTRPRLLIIPSVFSTILAVLSPIAYGAAVASVYPWQALSMDEMITVSLNGADVATSDLATVRSGFGMAIVSAVVSCVGCVLLVYNLYFVKVAVPEAGHELSVLSAVPVPVTDVLGDATRGEGGLSTPPIQRGTPHDPPTHIEDTQHPQASAPEAHQAAVTTPDDAPSSVVV